jgi:hypothetical protein
MGHSMLAAALSEALSRTRTTRTTRSDYAGITKRPFSRISRVISSRWRAVREKLGEWILPGDEVDMRAGMGRGKVDGGRESLLEEGWVDCEDGMELDLED